MKRAGIVTLLLLVVIAACSTSGPRQTKLMKSTNMTISAAALRVQVRSLADRFSGLMEDVGEQVMREELDPARQRNALLWLTNGIPAMQLALFQPDPLAALLDAWFLVAQMRTYFEHAAEHGMPPHLQTLATRVLDALREERLATFEDLDALMDEAFTREVNKMFARGLVLIGLFLAGFAVIAFLGIRAIKRQQG